MKKEFFFVILSIAVAGCSKEHTQPAATALPAANGQAITVTIDQTQTGYTIPASFLGLSYEVDQLSKTPAFLSAGNAVLLKLMSNLGPGILRLGGNSSDRMVWTGRARSGNTGIDSLATSDIDTFSAFDHLTGWPVLFGLNLGGYDTAAASNETRYISNSLGTQLYAFQIGNEPDLFFDNGTRPRSYNYTAFQNEWLAYFSAVRHLTPQAPFAGPDDAGHPQWVTSFAANESAKVRLIDAHYYRTGPASDSSITYQKLLAPDPGLPAYLQALNSAAKGAGLNYRISECNSVYNGGKPGVSDIFASSLWALDFMWTVAGNNGTGVNFHGGSGGYYSPLAAENGLLTARPEYYAMLAFKYGAVGGSILPVTMSQTAYNCSAYACMRNGATTVTLINKESSTGMSFTVQLSQTISTVQIVRLSAPAITSTTGVTFAGKSVNADGTFQPGTPEQYTVSQKTVVVNVPEGSAAIVTLQ